jgi:hypothetical protein
MSLLLRKEQSKTELIIRGPLGIWTFPILNTILLIFNILLSIQQAPPDTKPKAKTYNIVRDEQGRIISIEEIWIN